MVGRRTIGPGRPAREPTSGQAGEPGAQRPPAGPDDGVGHPGDDPPGPRPRRHQPLPGLSRLRSAGRHHRGGEAGDRRWREPVHGHLGLPAAAGTTGRPVHGPAGLGRRPVAPRLGHLRRHRGVVRRPAGDARPRRRGAGPGAGPRQLPPRLLPGRRRAGGGAAGPGRPPRRRAPGRGGHAPDPGGAAEHPAQPDRAGLRPRRARGRSAGALRAPRPAAAHRRDLRPPGLRRANATSAPDRCRPWPTARSPCPAWARRSRSPGGGWAT